MEVKPMIVTFEDGKKFIIDIKAGFNHEMVKFMYRMKVLGIN